MDDLQKALTVLGIDWADVWRLTADRVTGEVIVVVADGRKFNARLAADWQAVPDGEANRPRRVKAVKPVL